VQRRERADVAKLKSHGRSPREHEQGKGDARGERRFRIRPDREQTRQLGLRGAGRQERRKRGQQEPGVCRGPRPALRGEHRGREEKEKERERDERAAHIRLRQTLWNGKRRYSRAD